MQDPILLVEKAVAVALVVILVLILHGLIHRVQAEAAHPCPPGRVAMLAPTGWGCGDSLKIGGKSR